MQGHVRFTALWDSRSHAASPVAYYTFSPLSFLIHLHTLHCIWQKKKE